MDYKNDDGGIEGFRLFIGERGEKKGGEILIRCAHISMSRSIRRVIIFLFVVDS